MRLGLSIRRVSAQAGGLFLGSADDPAIQYSTAPQRNLVDDLNRRLQDGSARLTFEGGADICARHSTRCNLPIDSQMLVYSQGSLQGRLVGESNPRAIFFGDRIALAWVRDGELLEAAAHDERSGIVFYTLEQRPAERPVFKREFRCLGCHMTGETSGIPGLLMFSSRPDESGDRHMIIEPIDHRTPYAQRFGGWFVTGPSAGLHHLGNRVAALDARSGDVPSVDGLFGADGYRAATSDVAALVFSHQVHMTNLLTRASWEARAADPELHPCVSGSDRGRRGVDARHCKRSRRLHVVRRRASAASNGGRQVGLCRPHVGSRPSRSPRPFALPARFDAPPDEVPVQLPDLLAGVRRAAAAREDSRSTNGCGRSSRATPTSRAIARCPAAIGRQSSKSSGTPRRTSRRTSRRCGDSRHRRLQASGSRLQALGDRHGDGDGRWAHHTVNGAATRQIISAHRVRGTYPLDSVVAPSNAAAARRGSPSRHLVHQHRMLLVRRGAHSVRV